MEGIGSETASHLERQYESISWSDDLVPARRISRHKKKRQIDVLGCL